MDEKYHTVKFFCYAPEGAIVTYTRPIAAYHDDFLGEIKAGCRATPFARQFFLLPAFVSWN